MPLAAGSRLGPYEILSPLGAGGMGEVYRARDTRLQRTVAIKVLPPHLADRAEARERFEREAKAISSLSHPHICVLHDVGHQDGIDFLVMEHLEGETLAHRLRKDGALPFDQVLRFGIEIAEALERAHRQGIVHRDLKPANVMLTRTGAKLLDFGIAKLRPSAPAQATQPTLSEAGAFVGTPRYMSPEQLEGKPPDARSDIFALGCVLYEMATGRQAFPAENTAAVISAILSSTPGPVSAARPSLPPLFDRVVSACLAKDPDERWQSAHDVASQLRFIAEGAAGGRAATPTGRGRAGWIAAAIATGALGVGLGLVLAGRRGTPATAQAPSARFQIDMPEKTLLYGSAGFAVSPDGKNIVFRSSAEGDDGHGQLYLRSLATLDVVPLPGTQQGAGPFWSPDGRQIVFAADNALRKLDLASGTSQVLLELGRSVASTLGEMPLLGGTWNAEGTILVSIRGDLFRLRAAGGTAEPLGARGEGERGRYWPKFVPDGRHYLYLSDDERAERRGIYVAALDSQVRKRIVASDYNADFAPSGHLLFVRGQALVAQAFDASRLELSGEPAGVGAEPALRRFNVSGILGPVPLALFSVSSNGVLAWVPHLAPRTSLVWLDRAGKELGTVGEPAAYSNPALSPDERSLAVDVRDGRARDIWIFDLVRGGRRRLTRDPAEDMGAVWHPDGSRLAFISERRGTREIFQKPANGSRDEELLFAAPGALAASEDWSPDGKWLVCNVRRRDAPQDLVLLPTVPGAPPKPVPFLATEFIEDMAQFSPDGRFLAYRSDESGRSEVFVRDVAPDGSAGRGKWQVSTEGGVEPRWRGDGKELFYFSVAGAGAVPGPGTLLAVPVRTDGATFEAGVPKSLFSARVPEQRRNRFVVTRDGQRFLVNREDAAHEARSIHVLVNWLAATR